MEFGIGINFGEMNWLMCVHIATSPKVQVKKTVCAAFPVKASPRCMANTHKH